MTAFTNREKQVALLVAEGFRNKEVAEKLGMSSHTVKTHLIRIYQKINVKNRVELMIYVLKTKE